MRGLRPLITPKKIKKQTLLVGRASPVRWGKDPSVEERKAFLPFNLVPQAVWARDDRELQ